MKIFSLITIIVLTFLSILYFANISYENTIKYNEKSKTIIDKLNIVDNLKLKLDTLLHEMKFKEFGETEQFKLNKLNQESKAYLAESRKYLLFYFLIIVIIAIMLFFLERNLFSLFISIVAIMSLSIALFTPMLLLIVKTQDLFVIGQLSLQHEVKTIVGVIAKLIEIGNYLLAFVLILVSILIPFIKSFIILIHHFMRLLGRDSELHQIIKTIGKWSMVDVLVVAILVVFFTTNEEMTSEMIIESGLYFFMIYIFFSMISTYEMLMVSTTSNDVYNYNDDFEWDEYE